MSMFVIYRRNTEDTFVFELKYVQLLKILPIEQIYRERKLLMMSSTFTHSFFYEKNWQNNVTIWESHHKILAEQKEINIQILILTRKFSFFSYSFVLSQMFDQYCTFDNNCIDNNNNNNKNRRSMIFLSFSNFLFYI